MEVIGADSFVLRAATTPPNYKMTMLAKVTFYKLRTKNT